MHRKLGVDGFPAEGIEFIERRNKLLIGLALDLDLLQQPLADLRHPVLELVRRLLPLQKFLVAGTPQENLQRADEELRVGDRIVEDFPAVLEDDDMVRAPGTEYYPSRISGFELLLYLLRRDRPRRPWPPRSRAKG